MCQTQSKRSVTAGEVLLNEPLCSEHFRIVVRIEQFGPCAAGQFVQLQCAPAGSAYPAPHEVSRLANGWFELSDSELAGNSALLRRPISLAGATQTPDGQTELDMIYRVVGVGTGFLQRLAPGDTLGVLGPLGNPFPIFPDKPIAALIGGGVGIPPMLYLAKALKQTNKQAVAFCGIRSEHLLPLTPGGEPICTTGHPALCIEQFNVAGVPAAISSDDGTIGREGLVTDTMLHWMRTENINPANLVVYACGPEPMLKALGDLCAELAITCMLSLERQMACGMGTCQSCVVKIAADNPDGWRYGLCCKDGPVFNSNDLLWD